MKEYIRLSLEVIEFEEMDIITNSDPKNDDTPLIGVP